MNGYELNDKDTQAMVRWLKIFHPENANEAFAKAMLISMQLNYRQMGWDDPDKLEDHYREYTGKEYHDDKTSDK
ncbi:MAG TPA: hypothetical protein VMR34_05230 [Candidatus Saccharimonadales bacterium]|nr:hypothetical protein [Candidatus Saccharimonadales bacterium]